MNGQISEMRIPACLVLAVLLLSVLANAQSLGTLTGTVADQTGAIVPKANVTLVNEGTGETRTTVSNPSGYFSFAAITPGTYTVKVKVASFKGWEQKGIAVRPGDVRDITADLEVGTATETVEVDAAASAVAPVDSGERSAVLTAKQIENLTLEGREATELIRTLPGFAAYNGGGLANKLASDPGVVALNGGGQVGTNYNGGGNLFRGGQDLTFDGAHIMDNGCNCGSTTTVNGDMVSEVKVQTSNFGADSAKGPLVVNVVGKSGTTSYHGEVYLHARDETFNSLDWAFKNTMLTSPKGLVTPPQSRYLYPGVQFGGPIPGTNKKLVFTTAFEYYYQNQIPLGGTNNGGIPGILTDNVPTLSMRAGDFSQSGSNSSPGLSTNTDNADLCNGLGYPSNWSPLCGDLGYSIAGQMDPGGVALINQVPLPNANPLQTRGYNYVKPENTNQNGWMERTRVDYNLSDNDKVYATYQIQKETDTMPVHIWWQPTNSIPFPGGLSSHDNSQTVSGHYIKIVNPTLTNDFSGALGYINFPLVKNDPNAWSIASTGYPYKNVFNTNSNMAPAIGNGYWLSGMPQMIQNDLFENGCTNSAGCGNKPFVWKKWNLSLEDNVTKVFKTHTFKMGFYWEKTVNDQGANSDLSGHFEALQWGAPCGHGNPVANFLLGCAGYDQVSKYALDNLWYPTYSGYVQDDWKATKRLTLNLGLRLDHLGEWRTPNGAGIATWINDPTQNPSGSAPGYSWHGIQSNIPVTSRSVNAITWEPRIGIAYDLHGNGKTVLRGGWGEYGYRDQWNNYQTPTDVAQGVRTYNSDSSKQKMADISALNGTIDPATRGCGPGTVAGGTCGNLVGFDLRDHNQPITRSFNFTVSHQTPWNSLLEIGYVGSTTHYAGLVGNTNNLDVRNLNIIPTGALFALAPNPAFPSCTNLLDPANPNCDVSTSFGTNNSGGVNGGGANLYTLTNYYGNNVTDVTRHIGKANYNAMQISWTRQRGRISYNLNYTWSKALGTLGTAQLNGASDDAINLAHDYGVLSIDRSHIVNLTYTVELGNPVRNRALGYVTNGWMISGITTWQSGGDMVTQADGATNLGMGGTGPLDPHLDSNGNKQGYPINAMNWLGTNNVALQPTVVCNPTANLKAHQYFNESCFSVPAAGEQGWWQLPYIHGPAYFNSDLALSKTFKVTERQNVQLRLSAFNFLNHPLDSFTGVSDNKISFNYANSSCPNPGGAANCWVPYGSGSWVAAGGTPTVPGGPVSSGYASEKLGRRVVEFSLKYKF